MTFLDGLNEQQRDAVRAPLGPTLVLAGPGSGKTYVLTQRINYLIEQLGIQPTRILAVTFTNKAARSMEDRLRKQLGQYSRGLTLGTFHRICSLILRREAVYLPFNSNFVIFDSDDQARLLKNIYKELNIDPQNFSIKSVHNAISNAKNELILPEKLDPQDDHEHIVLRVYKKYQQYLFENNALDFDDLLLMTVLLMEEKSDLREKYSQRYQQILVDEFQDTNIAQYRFLRHLTSYHKNIYVVGDVDQSIYRWRGADYRNVRRFENDFPNARRFLLEENYRSTQEILNAAMAVIKSNSNRVHKNLRAVRGHGAKLSLKEVNTEEDEARYVVETIIDLVRNGVNKPGDFAVMYRTNAQSRLLEQAFVNAGQPYKIVGAQRFYGRKEVKDVIAYLRLVYNPADEISLLRVISVPPRRIGAKTQEALREEADRAQMSAGDLLVELAKGEESPFFETFSGRTAVPLAAFGSQFAGWREAALTMTPRELMDRILADIDYESYLDTSTDEGLSRWENVQELRRLAADFEEQDLMAFLEHVALISDQDTIEDGNVPTLLTLHAAKGLEFPVVFIVGLVEGVLPHARSIEDINTPKLNYGVFVENPEAVEEERRLFYVGITRAKDKLHLIHSNYRPQFWLRSKEKDEFNPSIEPSRFLADIPSNLFDIVSRKVSTKKLPSEAVKAPRWEQGASQSSPTPRKRTYAAGMKVRHASWGDGMVLNSRLENDDETVDVFFEKVGLKRVAASLAGLKILER